VGSLRRSDPCEADRKELLKAHDRLDRSSLNVAFRWILYAGLTWLGILGCAEAPILGFGCGDAISLGLRQQVQLTLDGPTAGLAPMDDSTIVRLNGITGELELVSLHTGDPKPFDQMVFTGVSDALPLGVLAFSDRQIVHHISPGERRQLTVLSPDQGRIKSAVLAGDALWMLTGTDLAKSLRLFRPSGAGGFDEVKTWSIPGNWRLTPMDKDLLLAETRSPFRLAHLSPEDQSPEFLEMSGEQVSRLSDNFLQGVHYLGCDRALLTFTDLESQFRFLAVVDVDTGDMMSRTTLNEPLGVFAADKELQQVLVFRSGTGGGAILAYEWAWRE